MMSANARFRDRQPARIVHPPADISVSTLRSRLLAWYRSHKRSLPWRADPSPYKVWISEIMLQQTRVQTVLPYYERFLRRFPGIESLATATESEVLEYWAGLGYYHRARNLRHAARKIMTESGGVFPVTLDGIASLPGIGRYTAGAIYSIAFNRPQSVVDGNVRRVVSRVNGVASAPETFYWSEAERWLARRSPADFNQALMELGALVCTPARPSCGTCPLRLLCRSVAKHAAPGPVPRSNAGTESVKMIILVIRRGDDLLLARQTETSFIPGAWALPFRRIEKGTNLLEAAGAVARSIFRKRVRLTPGGTVRHAITSRRILAHVVTGNDSALPPLPPDGRYVWLKESQAIKQLTSSLFRKALSYTWRHK